MKHNEKLGHRQGEKVCKSHIPGKWHVSIYEEFSTFNYDEQYNPIFWCPI